MFKKILKLLLWCVIFVGLAGLLFWASLTWALPWWVGAACYAGILGLFFGFCLVRRLLVRRQQKRLIQHVVATNAPLLAEMPQDHDLEKELRDHWTKALADLKHSSLQRIGNPLKVMPWYLMLGESRDGKTTAIKNSQTSSPLTDIDPRAQQQGTRNCDWWFCDQAIILDTAGRYSIPVDETQDRKEWEIFLELLLKTRRGKTLQGVIVSVAADRLLREDALTLIRKGQMIRQRLNQLMQLTGYRLPVYLLITKMDLVHGFADFFQGFRDEQVEGSMGVANSEPDCSWQQTLDQAFSILRKRLHALRQILAHTVKLEYYPGAVQFPNEFQLLREPLGQYGQGLFGFDQYLETPFLRGIYFSSGMNQGQPFSPFLKLIGATPSTAGTAEKQA